MDRQDAKAPRKAKIKSLFPGYSWFLGVFAAGLLLPLWVEACPRCVDATPYKNGLLWAVLFLMPIPFLLAGGVIFWIARQSKSQTPKGS